MFVVISVLTVPHMLLVHEVVGQDNGRHKGADEVADNYSKMGRAQATVDVGSVV